MSRCLIVFAKEPLKGQVKTRLAEHIGEEKTISLYRAFVRDALSIARLVEAEKKILAFDCDSPKPEYLSTISEGFDFYRQIGNNLGEKMNNAFKYAKEFGNARTIIIGSDSPTLPISFIEDAFLELENNDVVIGPSLDGGYYLIGIRGYFDGLFENIAWSSEGVFQETAKNAKLLNKKISVLGQWYDVDTVDDLKILCDSLRRKNSGTASFTREVLAL